MDIRRPTVTWWPGVRVELVEELDGGTVVFRLSGELDMATSTSFQQAVSARLSEPEIARATLSLAGLTFTDSAGLTALVAIQEQADRDGVPFVLTGVSRQVRRLMEVTSMLSLFDIR